MSWAPGLAAGNIFASNEPQVIGPGTLMRFLASSVGHAPMYVPVLRLPVGLPAWLLSSLPWELQHGVLFGLGTMIHRYQIWDLLGPVLFAIDCECMALGCPLLLSVPQFLHLSNGTQVTPLGRHRDTSVRVCQG